ncbi:uncharacterized protein TNCV_5061751 [Trichonephila clavipes]|nr:uncharacterized protein TNCV_5061751 [Trichonephila clavipes]
MDNFPNSLETTYFLRITFRVKNYSSTHYMVTTPLLSIIANQKKEISIPLHQLCVQCDVEQCGELYRSPGRLHTRTWLSSVPKTNRDSSLNTTFCQSVTVHIDLAWHHCRRSCRCSGVKGSARKGRLDLRFASARCLEIVCGTIATPTSARIVERVTVGLQVLAARSFDPLPGRSRPSFPRVGTFLCSLLPTISNGTLQTIHLASNTVH